MISIYAYKNCSTCRDALKWLAARNIPHEIKPIRETPPSIAELTTALQAHSGDLRKLFNTSGLDYRSLGLKDRLPAMTESEALALLHQNGNLVKRPFVIGDGISLVGFKEAEWKIAFG